MKEPNRGRDRYNIKALLVYLVLSIFFFGRALLAHPSTVLLGNGDPDPSLYMWCMEWWPYALSHHVNLFVTRLVWAPRGFNLAWTTSIPLISYLAFPLKSWIGLIPTFNLLAILFPAIAAWIAFILCRHLTRQYWPALIGGYIFGFSSCMLAQIRSHFFCEAVFILPLIVYLVVRKLEESIRTLSFVLLLAAALTAQFLISKEIFATSTMFGAIALLLALCFNSGETRTRLAQLMIPIAGSYAIAVAIVSPYLYYLFAQASPNLFFPPEDFSADLVNFAIPTRNNALGNIPILAAISNRFQGGNIGEIGACLSLPLIVITILFAWHHWRQPGPRLMLHSLAIICVLSLGPVLHMAGQTYHVELPELFITLLPLIGQALPMRFILYAFLDLALITSLWLATIPSGSPLRYIASIAVIGFLLPNPSAAFWVNRANNPAFFTSGLYQRYLAPGETVLILPYGYRGDSMLWQAETHMYFKMAGGWTWPAPAEFERWPIVRAFFRATEIPHPAQQLKAFLANHDVGAVIVTDRDERIWQPLLQSLGVKPTAIGGVKLYRIPPALLDEYRNLGGLRMERRATSIRLRALVIAANRYLAQGGSLKTLAPYRLHQLELLPPSWLVGPANAPKWLTIGPSSYVDPDALFSNDLWASSWKQDKVAIGTFGTRRGLEPLMAEYRKTASRVLFVSQRKDHPGAPDERGLMIAIFDRSELAAAAARLQHRAN